MDQNDLKHRGNKFRSFRIFRVQIIKIFVFFRAFRGYLSSPRGGREGVKKKEDSTFVESSPVRWPPTSEQRWKRPLTKKKEES